MKKILVTMALTIVLALSGCGHKSNSELVDIEQFRCQDSIETVFDVLGKTDIVSSEYYKYDELNLWGYEGSATFYVRDNKETITDFECNLILNRKEFDSLLSQFKDKYGTYDVSEIGEETLYKWNFPTETAIEYGYDTIYITDCGNKEYEVSFMDEWSIYKDEAYYEYLEEKEAEENKLEILADKTYAIGEDTFNFSIGKRKNGEYSFTILCEIADKSDALYTHISLNAIMNSEDGAIKPIRDMLSYSIIIGDGTSITRTNDALMLMSSEGEILSVDDYFSAEWVANEFNNSDYGTQVTNFLVDFIENEW